MSRIYQGDCIDAVYDIVNTELSKYTDMRLERYPIEQIVDVLVSTPPTQLPKCACGSGFALVPCRNCKTWACADCRKDHSCGSGEDVYPFSY